MTTTPAAANPPMEDFAQLFEESLSRQEMRQGQSGGSRSSKQRRWIQQRRCAGKAAS
jgi:hypothetical protein